MSDRIVGPWQPVSRALHVNKVPTVVNGFGRTIEATPLTITVTVERRPVWEFVGYEERTVES